MRRKAPSPPPAAPAEPHSLGRWAAVGLFLLALAVRLAVARSLALEPLFRSPQLDALEYLRWAREIAAGSFPWPVPPPHGLGYPVFLGMVLRAVGGSLDAARCAQAALGGLTVVLTGALAARLFARRAGVAAGVALALCGPVVFTEISFLGEGLLLFLVMASFWMSNSSSALSGGLLGAAALVRPTAIAALPALLYRRSRRDIARIVAGFLIVVAPVVAKISIENRRFVPVQGFGGLNFAIGNDLDGDGTASKRLGDGWEAMQAQGDHPWFVSTMAEWRSRPLEVFGLWARKAGWTLQAEEIRDSHSLAYFAERSPLVRWLPGFGLLFPLAALGLWTGRLREGVGEPARLLLALLALLAVPVALVVGSRYRLPVAPFAAVFAGLGAMQWIEAGARRDLRRLAVLLCAVTFLWGATHLRRHAPTHDLREEMALNGAALESLGERTAAEAAYRRVVSEGALSEDAPSSAEVLARKGLGRLALEAGRIDEADRLYADLTQRHPQDANAWVGLARVRGAQGRAGEGLLFAERAAGLSPALVEAWVLCVALGTSAGETATAERAFQQLEQRLGSAHPLVVSLAERLGPRSGSPGSGKSG